MGYPINGVSSSGSAGMDLAWEWFKLNFEELKKRAGNAMGIMNALIQVCAGNFVTEEKAAEVEAFFQEHPVPGAQRKISQLLENMRINHSWLERMKSGKLGDDGFFALIMMTIDMI